MPQLIGMLPIAVLLLLPATLALQIPFKVRPNHYNEEEYKFDPLLHLPGISPYFDAIGFQLSHSPPQNCEVTAASYLVRHAAIYGNDADYEEYIEPFLAKLNSTISNKNKKKRTGWEGPLSLFNAWKTPIPDPDNQLEQITPQGTKDSIKVGKHLLSRYPHLVPTTKRIYADTKSRTQDTAKAFMKAFPQEVELIELDQNKTSFHSQNPHKACDKFSKKAGDKELGIFISKYTTPIISRLEQYSPVDLNENDIVGMQQLCGYESAITGIRSEICNVFTDDEWMGYEYAWDMKYSYMVGHGNTLSPYLGFPWLNTTQHLFSKFHKPLHKPGHEELNTNEKGISKDDNGQRFFISFTHREVPPFIATALGLFNSSNSFAEEFPTDRINWSRSWRMAELIPFLGHIGIEKLTCGSGGKETEKEYIRIIANSAPRPIPSCQDGPGATCAFDEFVGFVKSGMEEYGDFNGVCGNEVEAKGRQEL